MVFFDVGDTLVQWDGDPTARSLGLLRSAGVASPAPLLERALAVMNEVLWSHIDACRDERQELALWRRVVAAGLDVLPDTPSRGQLADGLVETFAAYDDWYRVRDGMAELLADLHQAGFRLGVISNWPPSLPRFLRAKDLGPFEVVAVSGALGSSKPDAAIFRWALAQAGVAAERALLVGDSYENDYLGGRAVGLRCLLVGPGVTAGDIAQGIGL